MTAKHQSPRLVNVATTAIEQARRGRRVLVVVKNAFEATTVMEALENALPITFDLSGSRSNGRWYLAAKGWDGGRIEVAVSGPSLRGRSADTLLLSVSLHDGHRWRDTEHDELLLATSSTPLIVAW